MKKEYLRYVKNAGEVIRRNFNLPELDEPLKKLNEMYKGNVVYCENDPFGEEDWNDNEDNIDIDEVEKIAEYFDWVIYKKKIDMDKNTTLKNEIENRFLSNINID